MKHPIYSLAALSLSVCGFIHAQTISRPPIKQLTPALSSIPAYMDNKDHVFIYEKDGKLQTGIYERHTQPVTEGAPLPPGDPVNIRTQWRIFEGELFETTDFNSRPAVRSDRPGWANDPSELFAEYLLTPNSSLSITALAFKIEDQRRNFFYWDGEGETPNFTKGIQSVCIQLWNQDLVYPQKTLLDGSNMDRQGPELATIDANGKFNGHHAHRDFSLVEIPYGQKNPKGIFLMKLQVNSSASNIASSDPIYWVLNSGLAAEKRVAASEWVYHNLLPAEQQKAIEATRIMNPPDPNATTCNCQGTICKKTAAPKSEGGYMDPSNASEDSGEVTR